MFPRYDERTFKLPGFALALKNWNPKAENPILCLHGKMDNAASFDLLAPLLSNYQLVAVDYPGTGYSSHYPPGVLPNWKNDALLMLQLLDQLQWQRFDIIAHSLGSLLANILAIARPKHIRKIVFLDILGPTINFIEQGTTNLLRDVNTFLDYDKHQRTIFASLDAAIQDRMTIGNISYQAAQALVNRGMIKIPQGWVWTFDPRLRCVSSTVPYEDELRTMLKGINVPVCLIRGHHGVSYPEPIFRGRAECIKDLRIHEVQGSHHLHLDNPEPVATIISEFFAER